MGLRNNPDLSGNVISAATPTAAPGHPKLVLLEFFAGGGLARLGFGPGWEVAFANDFCARKARVYRDNFPGEEFVDGDVALIRALDLPWADAWTVSFPCTDHSTAGRMQGFEGSRGSAVFQVVKRLQAAKRLGRAPSVIVLENVVGFVSHGDGADFRLLVGQMLSCGYSIGAAVMDAKDWLPQGRRRVFLVAVRAGTPLPEGINSARANERWHPPVLRKAVERLDAEAAARWIWWNLPAPEPHSTTLGDILETVAPEAWFGPQAVHRFLNLVDKPGTVRLAAMRAAGRPTYGTMVERTDPNTGVRIASIRQDTAFTLMASATGSSRQRLLMVNGNEVRIREYTPKELGRLMGVPETYRMPSGLCPAMAVMGDAVAVPVVSHLVRHVVEPLVLAARRADGEIRPRAPQNGHRPIKARTSGILVYLLPGEHQQLKAAAANDSTPLYKWLLEAANDRLVASGQEPLQSYRATVPVPPRPSRPAGPKTKKKLSTKE